MDITNFVMLERATRCTPSIFPRCAGQIIAPRSGEKLTTLDGRHELTDDMLVIADADSATGLAGIMGGEESEIGPGTRSVLFECAALTAPESA